MGGGIILVLNGNLNLDTDDNDDFTPRCQDVKNDGEGGGTDRNEGEYEEILDNSVEGNGYVNNIDE